MYKSRAVVLHYTFYALYSYHPSSVTAYFLARGRVCFIPRRFIISHSNNGHRTPSKPEVNFLFLTDSRFVEMLSPPKFRPVPYFDLSLKGCPLGHVPHTKRSYSCFICSFHYYCDCKLNFGRQSFFNVTYAVVICEPRVFSLETYYTISLN